MQFISKDFMRLVLEQLEDKTLLTVSLVDTFCRVHCEDILLQRIQAWLGYIPNSWRQVLPYYRQAGQPCIYSINTHFVSRLDKKGIRKYIYNGDTYLYIDVDNICYANYILPKTTPHVIDIAPNIGCGSFLLSKEGILYDGRILSQFSNGKCMVDVYAYYDVSASRLSMCILYLTKEDELMLFRLHDKLTFSIWKGVKRVYKTGYNVMLIITESGLGCLPRASNDTVPAVALYKPDKCCYSAEKVYFTHFGRLVLTSSAIATIEYRGNDVLLSSSTIKDVIYNGWVLLLYHDGRLTFLEPTLQDVQEQKETIIDTDVISCYYDNGGYISYIRKQ